MRKSATGKTLVALLAGVCLSLPVYADYVVHLKNGRKITAIDQWQEKNRLKIKTQRGVIGVPMRSVVKVEKIEDRQRKKYSYYGSDSNKQVTPSPNKSPKKPPPKGFVSSPETDKNKYVSELKQKMQQENWPARYKKWDQGKDDEGINADYRLVKGKKDLVSSMEADELKRFQQEIDALRNKILGRRMATNYASELKDLYAISDSIEQRMQ